MTNSLPFGSWPSPITAADVARGTRSLSYPAVVAGPTGVAAWWIEGRPENDGRYALVGRSLDGETVTDIVSAEWNPRSRIIEYGARPWVHASGHGVVFTAWDDQRLYLKPDDDEPHPLTVAPDDTAEHRYGEPVVSPDGHSVWAVRETHRSGAVSRAVVAVPLDGSAADDDGSVRVLADGHDFFAAPTPSPDGQRLAYVAWDHPRMPWDGTTLYVVDLAPGHQPRALIGGDDESVLNPLWADDESLYCLTDRTGWWLPHRVDVSTSAVIPLVNREEEFGQALWELGLTTMQLLDDGRLVVLHGRGESQMSLLDPATGDLEPVASGLGWHEELGVHGRLVAGIAGSATTPSTVFVVDTVDASLTALRASTDEVPDARYLSESHPETLPSVDGRVVHAHVYPPRNGDVTAPSDERPPYLAFVHGGPTSHAAPGLSLMKAYFTSRGIGVIDVNYGGSTGYGRAYRNLLRGQWGVIDVEDTVAAVRALADRGDADGQRLGIRGGSAGGWTTLAALATS
ncbi:MAG: prolyl oligopeptidase family serine peptidase, partial [Actinomycetes bacterium]